MGTSSNSSCKKRPKPQSPGTGSFGTDPLDNAFSAPGNADRDPTIGDIEISTLINLTGTNTNPFGPFMGNPDTFDPFVVGEISFLAGQIFRSGLEFDLSALHRGEWSYLWFWPRSW